MDVAPKNRSGPGIAPHLREAVLGAIDGTVTTFAIVAGVAGAGLSPEVIVTLGTANVVADGFSMAAGVYSGSKADQEAGAQRRQDIGSLVADNPQEARSRLMRHFEGLGLRGQPLQQATEAIASDSGVWVEVLSGQGRGLASPWRDGVATFAAFLACGLIPLLPFFFSVPWAFGVSAALTGLSFLGIGALRSRWSLRSWWSASVETLCIGGLAAALAFAVGYLLEG